MSELPEQQTFQESMKPAPTLREQAGLSTAAARQRLHALREQGNLSQQQLADRLGLTQRAYAHWERNPVALRPDQLLGLAEVLNVSVDDLVGTNGTRKRGAGPTGKMKQLFDCLTPPTLSATEDHLTP